MNTDTMLLAIEDEDGPVCECTTDEFVDANLSSLADEDLADLAHMSIGDVLRFGGGAQPVFRVTRVA